MKSNINNLSVSELKQALKLKEQIVSLNNKLSAIMGSDIAPARTIKKKIVRKSRIVKKVAKKTAQAKNEINLKDHILRIAEDGQTRDANGYMEILKVEGWKTNSPKPYSVIAQALHKLEKKNKLTRVAKGQYAIVRVQ